MADNVFNSATMVWKVVEIVTNPALTDLAPGLDSPVVGEIIYIPSAVGNDLVFQDGDASEDAVVLKAGASDASPVHKSFRPQGKTINNLTCTTLSAGTAYVYLM